MGASDSLSGLGEALAAGTYLLNPNEVARLEGASAAVNQAIAQAENYLDRARAVYVQHERLGYLDGKARAQKDAALRLVDETAQLEQVLDLLTTDLASIIVRSVQTLIGEMPQAERAEGMARCALAQFRQQTGLSLRVPPQERAQAEALSSRLCQAIPGLGNLHVVNDADLRPQTLVVEGMLGRVLCDARQLLDTFESAWQDTLSPGGEVS